MTLFLGITERNISAFLIPKALNTGSSMGTSINVCQKKTSNLVKIRQKYHEQSTFYSCQ